MYVNAPRYLLRKFCALKLIRNLPRGKVLEIGCGAGDFCETLCKMGFDVLGIDSAQEAIRIASQRLDSFIRANKIRIECSDFTNVHDTFDIVVLFEVLEHLRHDREALGKIQQLIRSNGYLLISVPAHQKFFGAYDRYAGHFRRYDKKEIVDLLQQFQFKVETIWSYGVPLANLTEMIRNFIYRNKQNIDMAEGTRRSGINRDIETHFRFLFNDVLLFPFYLLQMAFVSRDWGRGYVIKARKIIS